MINFFKSIGNFFSGIFNFFGTTGNFISFLLNNIWWLIGGALVAFIVILIISLILHSFPNWIITTLVCIFCIGGALGLAAIFQKPSSTPDDSSDTTKPSDTLIINPSDVIKIVSNGGYNSSYINAKENDPHCPTSEDKTFDINLIEYNDRAIFYYDIKIGTDKYYTANIIFNKTSNGLVPVGSFNVHGIKANKKNWKWEVQYYNFINEFDAGNTFMNFNNSVQRYNGGTILQGFFFPHNPTHLMPTYYDISNVPYDLSITMQSAKWAFDDYKSAVEDSNQLHNTMQTGIYKIYQDNFQQLDKLGIKCSSDIGASADMTSFYNALYNATKSNGCSSVVDVTDLVADVQYGIVYKSNRFMNVNYTYRNTNVYATNEQPNKDLVNDYLDHNKPDSTITTKANPMLNMTLVQTNDKDLTTFNIATHPVTVKLTNTETQNNYMFIFDDIDKLNKGIKRAVPFGTYDLTITSNVLDFGGTTANVTTTKESPNIELRYEYKGDSVNSKITLSPVRSIDLSNFDISATPVTIVLVNKETQQTYEVKFDTQEKFEKGIVENVKLGNYTYSIVSAGLSFELATGEFTLTNSSFDCVFYYDYVENVEYELTSTLIEGLTSEGGIIGDEKSRYLKITLTSKFLEFITENSLYMEINVMNSNGSSIIYKNKITSTNIKSANGFNLEEYVSYHTIYQVQVIFSNDKTSLSTDFKNINYGDNTRYFEISIDLAQK